MPKKRVKKRVSEAVLHDAIVYPRPDDYLMCSATDPAKQVKNKHLSNNAIDAVFRFYCNNSNIAAISFKCLFSLFETGGLLDGWTGGNLAWGKGQHPSPNNLLITL